MSILCKTIEKKYFFFEKKLKKIFFQEISWEKKYFLAEIDKKFQAKKILFCSEIFMEFRFKNRFLFCNLREVWSEQNIFWLKFTKKMQVFLIQGRKIFFGVKFVTNFNLKKYIPF